MRHSTPVAGAAKRQLLSIAAIFAPRYVVALEPTEGTFALLIENIALNDYPIRAIQAAVGSTCGTTRFTSGRDTANQMDPEGSVEAIVVTTDSIIGNRAVAGMKVDVEGFEIEVLRGCERALPEHRIKLLQLEWNGASQGSVGAGRRPVADLFARHGYRLFRPDYKGVLVPLADLTVGRDVFAQKRG